MIAQKPMKTCGLVAEIFGDAAVEFAAWAMSAADGWRNAYCSQVALAQATT